MLSWVLWVLVAGADVPMMEAQPEVEVEAIHHQVRLLDAEILALPSRIPPGYLVGTVALELFGVGLVPVGIFFTIVGFRSAIAGVILVGAFGLAVISIILGIACLVAGDDVVTQARERRAELVRKRDAALRLLPRPESFLAQPPMVQLAAF